MKRWKPTWKHIWPGHTQEEHWTQRIHKLQTKHLQPEMKSIMEVFVFWQIRFTDSYCCCSVYFLYIWNYQGNNVKQDISSIILLALKYLLNILLLEASYRRKIFNKQTFIFLRLVFSWFVILPTLRPGKSQSLACWYYNRTK